ncbi:porin family protein [Pseudopedobacter beijingensis]|uniref:Porin family protein n=1 Tax=Pseudopedobacter beijingensis TaxID=1207056 RepID=A0ABW4IFZ3_9SPHI
MKKLLPIVLLVLLVNVAKAQYDYDDEKDFKLGLTVHPNIGWLRSDVDGLQSDGAKLGFSYGVLADFMFAESYAFSTALKLTTINGKSEANENGVITKSALKLQYIEIPTKLKLLTGSDKDIRFFGEFGLGHAFNVRAKSNIKSSDPTQSERNVDIYKNTKFYRGSIIIGGGAEIKVASTTKAMVGLALDNGFTDIQKGNGTLKSSYLAINVGVFF